MIQPVPAGAEVALETWNAMGGEINFAFMDYAVENFMVSDVELLVKQLCTIRDHFRKGASDNG